ncbi:MAG: hypothetical protein FJZ58_06585 [Chlamydiae bacterium]|nr:hypothetical protein [Chlamydiota bacterium]
MRSKKPENKLSLTAKIEQTARLLRETIKKEKQETGLRKRSILSRSKLPDLSPANTIERISRLLREQADLYQEKKKKAAGE